MENDYGMTLKDLIRDRKEAPTHHDVAFDDSPIKTLFKPEEYPGGIDETPAGRVRLSRALTQKYGVNYKDNPLVKKALEHYEKEAKYLRLYKQIKGVKNG